MDGHCQLRRQPDVLRSPVPHHGADAPQRDPGASDEHRTRRARCRKAVRRPCRVSDHHRAGRCNRHHHSDPGTILDAVFPHSLSDLPRRGRLPRLAVSTPGGANVTAGAMIGLHAARFADYGVRWLYFLSGVAGSLMVASGLVLWTVKRREKLPDPQRPHIGFRIVAWLNVAVVAGFPLGMAAMLWANRLLPTAIPHRAEWEVHALFLAWAGALAMATVLREKKAWSLLLGSTGALLAALPVYNAFATSRGLPVTLAGGDFMLAGIDVALIVMGGAFLGTAWRVHCYSPAARRVRQPRPATVPEPVVMPNPPVLEPAE
ncbi:PepSY-associated TM helix domain-containing protein [Novosphingobium panipatense]|uniref:PepSY-associated TM helix domain-containing protein n=1 Tax=Novosphingobium panipatense TaxID=428991 RepID=UPI003619A243